MAVQRFYLAGDDAANALDINISEANDLDALKLLVAGQLAIVEPGGDTNRVTSKQTISLR